MNNPSPIEFIQFSLLEGKQWEEYGVCEVSKPNTHGVGDLTNTVYDERMGVLEANKLSYTYLLKKFEADFFNFDDD